ncbi:MAG: spore protease YyaC [Bacillota bacterium]
MPLTGGQRTDHRLGEYKVHVEDRNATSMIGDILSQLMEQQWYMAQELVVLCIGTDRSTGDALGPLIGSKLEEALPNGVFVHGTLDYPVHATNLVETMDYIRRAYQRPLVVAVDACLGQADSVGMITIGCGPMRPGAGVNKELPQVGDLYLTGIVNVGGFMEYFVLQNTRLNLVVKLANTIAHGILASIRKLERNSMAYSKLLDS